MKSPVTGLGKKGGETISAVQPIANSSFSDSNLGTSRKASLDYSLLSDSDNLPTAENIEIVL